MITKISYFIGAALIAATLASCGSGTTSTFTSTESCTCDGVDTSCDVIRENNGQCPTIGTSVRCNSGSLRCNGSASSCSNARSVCSCSDGSSIRCTTTSSLSTSSVINRLVEYITNETEESMTFSAAEDTLEIIKYDEDGEIKEFTTHQILEGNKSSGQPEIFYSR